MQPEKARDEKDDDDDADDVENVHGVLRLRHTRFQNESTALQQERPDLQVCSVSHGEPSTVKMVNSIQIDIVDRRTIDAGRVTAAAAAPHSVSPVF